MTASSAQLYKVGPQPSGELSVGPHKSIVRRVNTPGDRLFPMRAANPGLRTNRIDGAHWSSSQSNDSSKECTRRPAVAVQSLAELPSRDLRGRYNEAAVQQSAGAQPTGGSVRRIGLVGCVKRKASSPRHARDLCSSSLFQGRRAYVERSCDEWWILSAEHGLVHPEEVLVPYDTALKSVGRAARRRWSKRVLEMIDERIASRPGDVIEIHAGAEYRDFGLVAGLVARGCVVANPTEGLPIGHQLQFYGQAAREPT